MSNIMVNMLVSTVHRTTELSCIRRSDIRTNLVEHTVICFWVERLRQMTVANNFRYVQMNEHNCVCVTRRSVMTIVHSNIPIRFALVIVPHSIMYFMYECWKQPYISCQHYFSFSLYLRSTSTWEALGICHIRFRKGNSHWAMHLCNLASSTIG